MGLNKYDDSIKKDESTSVIDFGGGDRISLYNTALKETRFLLGNERTDREVDLTADWTHFEFLLASNSREIQYASGKSHLALLKTFWGRLWPYIKKVLKDYEKLSESRDQVIADMDAMISNHAELKIKSDLYEEYVKSEMTPQEQTRFRHWYKEQKEALEEKYQEIRDEEARKHK